MFYSGCNKQVNRLVNEIRLLAAPLPDFLAAVRALLFAKQAFFDAHLAERVAADCSSAVQYEVHADGALEAVDAAEQFEHLLLVVLGLLLERLGQIVANLDFFLYQLHQSLFQARLAKWLAWWLLLVTNDS